MATAHPFFAATAQVLVVGVVAATWEALSRARMVDPLLFSAPSQIASALWQLLGHEQTLRELRVTCLEILGGFALAAVLGVALGLVIGETRYLHRALHLPILLFYSLPTVTLFPLFMLFFGVGMAQKIAFGAVFALPPILVNTIAASRGLGAVFRTVGRSLGGSRSQIWRKILIPAALPLVLSGLRLGMIANIIGVVLAEMFVSKAGLMRLMVAASENLRMAHFFAYVVLISLISLLLVETLRRVEVSWSRWRI
jgi:NitT/TauT family transport system permease protein